MAIFKGRTHEDIYSNQRGGYNMKGVCLAGENIQNVRGKGEHKHLFILSSILRQCKIPFMSHLEEIWENSEAGAQEKMNKGERYIWW
jgi:hypothetical protein